MKIYELVNMDNWRIREDVLLELQLKKGLEIDERSLRNEFEINNKLFYEHLVDKFIAHDNKKGYIATTDRNIIKRSIDDDKKRAIKLFTRYSRTLKALGENGNMNFIIKGDDMYFVEDNL